VRCRKGLENILARAVARINTSELTENVEVFGVEWHAFALGVGSVWASETRALSPMNAEPVKVFFDSVEKFGLAAGSVEVIDAKDEGAVGEVCAILSGGKSSGMSEVKKTSRGGGDSATIRFGFQKAVLCIALGKGFMVVRHSG
jgi:hypothetical protein